MVALQQNDSNVPSTKDPDLIALIADVRSQPNAEPELIAFLLNSIERSNLTRSPVMPASSAKGDSTASSSSLSYAAVLSPSAQVYVAPVDDKNKPSTVEYDRNFPPLEGTDKPSIVINNSTIELHGKKVTVRSNAHDINIENGRAKNGENATSAQGMGVDLEYEGSVTTKDTTVNSDESVPRDEGDMPSSKVKKTNTKRKKKKKDTNEEVPFVYTVHPNRGKKWNASRMRYERRVHDGDTTTQWIKSPKRAKVPKSTKGRTPKETRSKKKTPDGQRVVPSKDRIKSKPRSQSEKNRHQQRRRLMDVANKASKQRSQKINKKMNKADAKYERFASTISPVLHSYDQQVRQRARLKNSLRNNFPNVDMITDFHGRILPVESIADDGKKYRSNSRPYRFSAERFPDSRIGRLVTVTDDGGTPRMSQPRMSRRNPSHFDRLAEYRQLRRAISECDARIKKESRRLHNMLKNAPKSKSSYHRTSNRTNSQGLQHARRRIDDFPSTQVSTRFATYNSRPLRYWKDRHYIRGRHKSIDLFEHRRALKFRTKQALQSNKALLRANIKLQNELQAIRDDHHSNQVRCEFANVATAVTGQDAEADRPPIISPSPNVAATTPPYQSQDDIIVGTRSDAAQRISQSSQASARERLPTSIAVPEDEVVEDVAPEENQETIADDAATIPLDVYNAANVTLDTDITRRLEGNEEPRESQEEPVIPEDNVDVDSERIPSPFRDVKPDPILRRIRHQRKTILRLIDEIKKIDQQLSIENYNLATKLVSDLVNDVDHINEDFWQRSIQSTNISDRSWTPADMDLCITQTIAEVRNLIDDFTCRIETIKPLEYEASSQNESVATLIRNLSVNDSDRSSKESEASTNSNNRHSHTPEDGDGGTDSNDSVRSLSSDLNPSSNTSNSQLYDAAKMSKITQSLFKQCKLTGMGDFEISTKLPDRRQEFHEFIQELKLVCVVNSDLDTFLADYPNLSSISHTHELALRSFLFSKLGTKARRATEEKKTATQVLKELHTQCSTVTSQERNRVRQKFETCTRYYNETASSYIQRFKTRWNELHRIDEDAYLDESERIDRLLEGMGDHKLYLSHVRTFQIRRIEEQDNPRSSAWNIPFSRIERHFLILDENEAHRTQRSRGRSLAMVAEDVSPINSTRSRRDFRNGRGNNRKRSEIRARTWNKDRIRKPRRDGFGSNSRYQTNYDGGRERTSGPRQDRRTDGRTDGRREGTSRNREGPASRNFSKRLKFPVKSRANSSRSGTFTPACYICKGDHYANRCPQRSGTKRRQICYFCKGDHSPNECPKHPQKTRAYVARDQPIQVPKDLRRVEVYMITDISVTPPPNPSPVPELFRTIQAANSLPLRLHRRDTPVPTNEEFTMSVTETPLPREAVRIINFRQNDRVLINSRDPRLRQRIGTIVGLYDPITRRYPVQLPLKLTPTARRYTDLSRTQSDLSGGRPPKILVNFAATYAAV